MPLRLDSQSADFPERFRSLLALRREATQDVDQVVRGIVADVAARGDTALFELTARFDRIDLAKTGLRVTAAEIETAEKACQSEALSALKFARDRIEAYHHRQKPSDERFTDPLAAELGTK
jgi:histidinol dehydrogenase